MYRERLAGVSFHFVSGERRHTPLPEQGTSNKTRSPDPATAAIQGSYGPVITLRVTFDTPARLNLDRAFLSLLGSISHAINRPPSLIEAARASVLPPLPAHKSMVVIFASAPTSRAIN